MPEPDYKQALAALMKYAARQVVEGDDYIDFLIDDYVTLDAGDEPLYSAVRQLITEDLIEAHTPK